MKNGDGYRPVRKQIRKVLALLMCVLVALAVAGCGAGSSNSSGSSSTQKPGKDTVIAVYDAGGKLTAQFMQKDLEKLDTVTKCYSGRNKKAGNKRQIRKYTGVDLKTFLKKAGIGSAENIKVTCDDEYTKEYTVADLYDLYAFDSNSDSAAKKKVDPMITIKDRQLICGQADYDAADSKDFNMQNWASGICRIDALK